MQLHESQRDMDQAYYGGATGAMASGLVWIAAGCSGLWLSNLAGMLTLFFGGMLIFPLSMLFSKLLKRSGAHRTDNPLRHLAIENIGFLFAGLLIAFIVSQQQVALFFPVMLLVIGARYLVFQTLYGLKTYWVFGAVLMGSGALLLFADAAFATGAFAGGVIEVVFAVVLWSRSNSRASALAT
ncbi:DUF7010 family protein [Ferrimonas aestuarii]|uniref:Uncharacterized protein n=1 Tax=Ferrimonas aestuarii TaxID=2569539 RepID=A0A4V5NYY8_9GAMM|nr:hypothetical protein [Ferrimonas aestuarii]TKB57532.1 hypothetical protein FCL42_04470 [Ferrimonas aestuarii]